MPVNIFDNQKTGIAASNAVTLNNAVKELDVKKETSHAPKITNSDEMFDHMVQNGKKPDNAGMDVLKGLLSKAAQSNISLKALQKEISGKQDLLDDRDNSPSDDMVSISSKSTEGSKKQSAADIAGFMKQNNITQKEAAPILQQYVSLLEEKSYSRSLDRKKSLEKNMEELESEMSKKGLSKDQINSIKKQIVTTGGKVSLGMKDELQKKEEKPLHEQTAIKTETAKMIKAQALKNIRDSVLAREMASGKLEQVMADNAGFAQVDEYLVGILGLKRNSQEYVDKRNALVKEAQSMALEDIGDFSYRELESTFIQKCLKGNMSIDDKMTAELIKLAGKSGNINEWVKNTWLPGKDNMGFVKINVPDSNSSMMNDFMNGKQNSGKGQEPDDGDGSLEELLKSRLMATHVSGMLKTGLRARIETHFKVVGLEKQLKRIGVTTEVIGQLKEEARLGALEKGKEIVFEALLELTTILPDKTLPAYQLTERKLANTLKALEKMGFPLDEMELKSFRQNAAAKMRDIVRAQIKALEGENGGVTLNKQGESNLKMLKKLLENINTELGIENTEYGEEGQVLVA